MNYSDLRSSFEENGYVHAASLLDKEACLGLSKRMADVINSNLSVRDDQCSNSEAMYGVFDDILPLIQTHIEKISGKKLFPTYTYARLYKKGEVLKNHIDRPSCEISATLTIGFEGSSWPIFMGNHDKTEKSMIDMDVGDVVVYKGTTKHHWREEFQGELQGQIFLHYVDADGEYKHHKFDGREKLNVYKSNHREYCWVYDDILTSDTCDMLIKKYTSGTEDSMEEPYIGNFLTIDRDIRDVKRMLLPIYKDIGGRLAAAGLSANSQRWNFDITHSDQAEFLVYNPNGKYTKHIDTFLQAGKVCRKLTVLAFLNDDFEGGRFFIDIENERFYPEQKKGTVIVFPSFLPHGVETVNKGVRYSVVCWMVGPWFK